MLLKNCVFFCNFRSNRIEGGNSRESLVHSMSLAIVRSGGGMLRVPHETTPSVKLHWNPTICRCPGMLRPLQSGQQLCHGKQN